MGQSGRSVSGHTALRLSIGPEEKSGGQALAAAGAAGRDDFPSPDRRHSGAEPVAAFANNLAGLVGPFHRSSPRATQRPLNNKALISGPKLLLPGPASCEAVSMRPAPETERRRVDDTGPKNINAAAPLGATSRRGYRRKPRGKSIGIGQRHARISPCGFSTHAGRKAGKLLSGGDSRVPATRAAHFPVAFSRFFASSALISRAALRRGQALLTISAYLCFSSGRIAAPERVGDRRVDEAAIP
jgi:hypothetical protein